MDKQKIMTNKYVMSILAVICTLLWGSAFPAIKIGYKIFNISTSDIGSVTLFAGIRFTIGGIMVLIYAFFVNRKELILKKSDIIPISLLGLLQTFIQYIFLYIGTAHITGTKTAILNSLSTFIAVILSAIVFKNDKFTVQKFLGCLFGIIGIIIVNFNGRFFNNITFIGDGFVILSVICSACANIYSKVISQSRSAIKVTAYQLLIGGLMLVIVGIAIGGHIIFDNIIDYILITYMAFISAGAFVIWTDLLIYNDVSKVCIFNLLIPVFGTLWSGIFLHDNIFNIENLIALIMVCFGIFFVNYKFKK